MKPLEHQEAWDSMPWVLNGSATAAQRQRLLAHLPDCADCRAEWDFQRQLRAELAPQADPDALLARFWAHAPHGAAAEARELLVSEPLLQAAGVPSAEPRRPRSWWTPLLLTTLALHAGLLFWGRERPQPADYRLLSEASPAASGARIRLVPAPDLSLAQLQALIAAQGLQIVEASPQGQHFGLAPRDGQGTGFDAHATVLRLRAQPGVLLAEALPR
jgi:hypothetical protein